MSYFRVFETGKSGEYGLMAIWACTPKTLDLLPLNLESFGVILHVCPCCDACLLNLMPDLCALTYVCICSYIFLNSVSVLFITGLRSMAVHSGLENL